MSRPESFHVPERRLLILDDEEIVLAGLRETLVREGYTVVTASDAFAALDELKKGAFSVIISDYQMPGVTGLEFLAQAKELQPQASRILITAVLSLDTVIEAINKGEIYRFIVKPWLREELLATVRNADQRFALLSHSTAVEARSAVLSRELADKNRELAAQVARIEAQNQSLGRLNHALNDNLQHAVKLGLHVLQTFHPALGNQARRVHEICTTLASTIQLSPEQRQILDLAAWLHDIGLVGIPRDLIRRWQDAPESLKEDEQTVINSHPQLGQDLAKFGHHLKEVGVIIRAHHERFDGTGFPDQLKGDEIPWLARLLAVAVDYAASHFDETMAVEAIKQGSGTAYDPEAVRVFVRALPNAAISRKEREVLLSELEPGMVLASGIYTPNGLLLIPEGQLLNEGAIGKILNHNRVNPINQALLVYC